MQIYQLNTARNCLRVIIRVYGIKEIFMPYYICPCLWQACRAENCEVKFYHINDEFYPTQDFDEKSYILYPNYFGICGENVLRLEKSYKNLIVDNAHAFYMKPCGLASFNSYRKFFPKVLDGANLFIDANIDLPISKYDYDLSLQNYNDFVKNELRLNSEVPMFISQDTKENIQKINFAAEKERRMRKFYERHKTLIKSNELNIKLSKFDVPFVYPYLSENEINEPSFRYWSPLPKNFLEYKFYRYLKPLQLIELPYLK